MANRSNTALHASLIIMVMLTVGLAISTYYFFGQADTAQKSLVDERKTTKATMAKWQSARSKAWALMFFVGSPSTDKNAPKSLKEVDESKAQWTDEDEVTGIADIRNKFERDIATYGLGIPSPNYQSIPENLLAVLKSKNDAEQIAKTNEEKLQKEKDEVQRRAIDETKKAEARAMAAEAEQQKQRNDFDQNRDAWKKEKDTLLARVDSLGTQLNDIKKDSEKAIKQAKDEVTKTKNNMEVIRNELDKYRKKENFEVADGQITSVNQKTGTVYVNIGSAAGLRKQISFSVYDRNENSATAAQKKAGIEIVRVIDENSSEGRIVHTDNKNPILPGDHVYSPVWSTGRRLHFAVAGWIDLDNDGNNDRDLVRSLIMRNGGEIDTYQGDDGKVVGNMTIGTRYLVDINELPTKNVVDDRVETTFRKGRNDLRAQAQELGVKLLHVDELLDWMGWKPQDQTIILGASPSPDSARGPKSEPGGEFRRREPPAR